MRAKPTVQQRLTPITYRAAIEAQHILPLGQ
jgi:hypothetical protein